MCWAACDRLARIAPPASADAPPRGTGARDADRMRADMLEDAWSEERQAFAAASATRSGCQRCCCCPSSACCPRRSALRRRRSSASSERAAARRPAVPLRARRRFRRARERLHHLHLLVRRTRWRAAGRVDEARELFDAAARAPQSARPAVRGHRTRDRRAVGQLPADLQHGRDHRQRAATLAQLGGDRMSRLVGRLQPDSGAARAPRPAGSRSG